MAWRVLVTDGLEQHGLQLLREQAEVVESAQLQPCDALIVRSKTKVTREALSQLGTSLRVIGRAGVGVDNIDLAAAGELGITVVNAPQAATIAVAELTVGLMLALARQLPRADVAMHQGRWEKAELRGSELNGKQLGIVGMGRIGAAVAERAAAFGMQVSGYDPLLEAQLIRQRNAEPTALDQLLAEADYLCMHLPLNESTRGMIGAVELAKMKAGARLISVARGGIVDEPALLDALNRGQLAGAALDVFSNEPPGESELLRHPNLIATPHIGAQTEEAQTRAAIDIVSEVLAALRGDPLRWRVA
jgi:D-3-phosphoglycerate dehydrogenase